MNRSKVGALMTREGAQSSPRGVVPRIRVYVVAVTRTLSVREDRLKHRSISPT